jgi:hypothetical protein
MTHDGPEHGSVEEAAERLISLAEAAEVCGLSAAHLRRLVRSRLIWGKKIGRNWVKTEDAVREYLAQDRRPGPKPGDRPLDVKVHHVSPVLGLLLDHKK